jgi:phage terminase large subunit
VLRGRYRVEPFERSASWAGPYYGADWGFATDPTTLVVCWVDDTERTLYIEHEAYGVGVEMDMTPAMFAAVPDSDKHTIRADSARPETISYMQRHGYPRMVAAHKGPGSVEDGVEHLRSYAAIVIHPRCKHTAEEARLWSYKRDRLSGDVLPALEDRHNHCWDAIRYALEPIIKIRPSPSVRLL